jgi:hypothetical protein
MKNKEIHYHHLHVPLIESTSEIILNLSQYLHPNERKAQCQKVSTK